MSKDVQTTVAVLLRTPELAELGPGPRAEVLSISEIKAAVVDVPPKSRDLVHSLVLLWHDHLDASHEISQSIKNADGSFVHAIMHRREPDFWNSKYWWRNVGNHPAFPEIGKRVSKLLREQGDAKLAKALVPSGIWDPCAFVDACESATKQNEGLLRQIQRIETEVLLERLLVSS